MINPWEDIKEASEWIQNVQKEFKADILHFNSYCFSSLNWEVPVVTVAHSDVFSWWNDVKNEHPPDEWNTYYENVFNGLHNSDVVVAPSQYMLNALQKNFGRLSNTQVIYNGRRDDLFLPGKKKNFLMATGRVWDEAKNLILLVNAANRINYPVYIAGENNHPVTGKKLNIDGIHFTGKLNSEDISALLSQALIYVTPAKYEPFGLSVLEAALSGCALILGDIPSLKEVWGNSAIYVPTDNEKYLAAVVNALIYDTELLAEFSSRAYLHARKYSINKMCSEYLDLYNEMISIPKTFHRV
jgi:glycosyltransferase involved in cell wall biosynthesis